MQKDERDILEVLKFELQFLEKGGYGRSPRESWRPSFIFEDSPTCMNYDSKQNPGPCVECVLMHLVPKDIRSQKLPCRHIPLDASGETLESLYRYGNEREIEETVEKWLRATIARLEAERSVLARSADNPQSPRGENAKGVPMYEHLHPKCANPACPTAFHLLDGGKFYRFKPEDASAHQDDSKDGSPTGIHAAKHYWLCERCSRVFTLVYGQECGVVLKLIRPELPMSEARKELSAA